MSEEMYTADELEIRAALAGSPRADELIACLEGEIAKRDATIARLEPQLNRAIQANYDLREELAACRVAVENCEVFRARIAELEADRDSHQRCAIQAMAELSALKAQEPVAYISGCYRDVIGGKSDRTPLGAELAFVNMGWIGQIPLYAAPVSEAKAQGEYGEAYQGAREDLAIWKRRALEAEEKVLRQEQIIDHLTSEAQGESRFGEPVVTPDAPCVPDGYVLADKKALGTVLQALVNAPHHIRELQVTRQPVELFSDNPINVLIANYEAPAAPVQQPKCRTCDDNGRIGGPSFYAPDDGGEPCPDCCSPVQQVSVPDERIIPTSAELIQWAWEEEPEETRFQEGYNAAKRWVKMQIEAGIAAPAAPAADAWIPVSERLPNIAQEVIVHSEFDGVCAGVLDSYGEWFAPCSEYKLIRVTSWMPMPTKIEANRHD